MNDAPRTAESLQGYVSRQPGWYDIETNDKRGRDYDGSEYRLQDDYGDAPGTHPLFQMVKQNAMLRAGTPGAEVHAEVKTLPHEPVLNKTCVNPFLTTNLQQLLHSLDANTLILMGLWTNYVVETTARHASDIGHRVIVVREGCASNTEENHNFSMQQILPTVATVCSLDEVLQALR